jgi:hypothetical protein
MVGVADEREKCGRRIRGREVVKSGGGVLTPRERVRVEKRLYG